MIPVMIVDDELIVRVALKSMVDWEALGYCIVGEAKNGKEGLALYDELHPKLVLTDVMMPEMTGLEMMEEIRKKDAQVRFIVLSAYEDFKFAQQAIRMHAEEYVLKATMLEEDLVALLRRMFERLMSESAEPESASAPAPAALALAEGTASLQTAALFGDSLLQAVFCRFSGITRSEQSVKILLSIVENLLSEHRHSAVAWENGVLLIAEALAPERLARIMALLRDTTRRYLDAELRIGISAACGRAEECKGLAAQAKAAAVQSLFAPKEPYCIFWENSDAAPVSGGVLRQMRESLYLQQPEAAVQLLEPLFATVKQSRNVEALYELVLALSALLCECRGMTEPDKPERVMQIDDIVRIREYYIVSIYAAAAHLRAQESSVNPYIRQARDLLARRYAEELTLGKIAEELHLSANYLGKLYFSETGEHLMDALLGIRIEQAGKLLIEGNDSLAQIAESVGFNSQSYFTRQFQKYKGVSPSEYRKKHLKLKNES